MASEESAYLELLRRGRTGSDEAYLFSFGVRYDRLLDEIVQGDREMKDAPEEARQMKPKPKFWKAAFPYAMSTAAFLTMLIWTVKLSAETSRLASERQAFEEDCEERLAVIRGAYTRVVQLFTDDVAEGQLVEAHGRLALIEEFHRSPLGDHSPATLDSMRKQFVTETVELLYGTNTTAMMSDATTDYLNSLTDASVSNADSIKESLEIIKDAICSTQRSLLWTLEPDPNAIKGLLQNTAVECEWLFAQPEFSGPMAVPCVFDEPNVTATSLVEAIDAACQGACDALERYCNSQIDASRCSLLEVESILDEIGIMIGVK